MSHKKFNNMQVEPKNWTVFKVYNFVPKKLDIWQCRTNGSSLYVE